MKTINFLLLTGILVFALAPAKAQQTLTAKQIQEKSVEATRVAGTESIAKLAIVNEKGQERIRQMAVMTKLCDNGETEKKIIRFVAPADIKGTGFLTYDYNLLNDDKWIYLPALRKTRRIISSENAKSFMGSEFSYADMTLLNIDEFNYNLLGEEPVNGIDCYKIEIVPANSVVEDNNGFSKKISYIGKGDFVLRKSVYYDLFGEEHKILKVKSIVEVDKTNHKFRLKEIEITNIQNQRKSILINEKIQFSPDIPDDYFTTRYLER